MPYIIPNPIVYGLDFNRRLPADIPNFVQSAAVALENPLFAIVEKSLRAAVAPNTLPATPRTLVVLLIRACEAVGSVLAMAAPTSPKVVTKPSASTPSFASPDKVGSVPEFKPKFASFYLSKKAMGSAGAGKACHIVEQTPGNINQFGAQAIHNSENLTKLPHGAGTIHARVSGYYSSIQPFTGNQTVRQWLS
ncbi:hypothetical protein [Pararcticibacter amylolyticus]|nr:hypothetical protein [Pararcticibacter amylolyticus]